MERGNSKSSTKSNVSDSKSKQDVSNKYLRLPRVKESQSPRPDTRRKPNPQRSRELFDKRPRNKNGAMYEKYRSEMTEVNEPFNKQGWKKTNLNHLLNFTFNLDVYEGNGRRQTYNKSKHPKYNKELFLQANCQFIARDTGDYAIHQNDPDKLVEWSLIEEICLPCHEVPSCPICLHMPIAAKITRCGHVYCWPCMLHYLALTDKSWQKCPICFDAVHKTDLKSVSLKLCKSFAVGDEITLCLMKREKGSLLSVPVSFENPTQIMCTVNNVDAITHYQKLLLANKNDVYSILERENIELKASYEQEKDTPEVCFIETAMTLLYERRNALNQTVDQAKEENFSSKNVPTLRRKHLISSSSADSCEELYEKNENQNPGNASPENSNLDIMHVSNKKGVTFFYQAEDGQHIYLDKINVKMLLKQFGSLEYAPEKITARLVEIERKYMTEELRRKLRYLQHLPLTCEFNEAELDFSHIVTKETLSEFKNEIMKKKRNRTRKAQDERRREKKIEQEENKKLGKYPKATYNLSSVNQFPVYNPDDFLSLSPPKEGKIESSNIDYNSNSLGASPISYADTIASEDNIPTTSFAQMLKVGPKNFTRTTHAQPVVTTPVRERRSGDSDEDGDEGTPAPEYRQSFSDAIQMALNSVTLQDSTGNQNNSKKKKKGKKQQLLFTTSMCRNK